MVQTNYDPLFDNYGSIKPHTEFTYKEGKNKGYRLRVIGICKEHGNWFVTIKNLDSNNAKKISFDRFAATIPYRVTVVDNTPKMSARQRNAYKKLQEINNQNKKNDK